VITLTVIVTSSGGAFFRQQRVGRNGELFWLYKFRWMRANNTRIAATAGSDSRITSLGKLLRKSKLDELPQLYNVLRGDMSLVGPRPEVLLLTGGFKPPSVWRSAKRPSDAEFSRKSNASEGCLSAGHGTGYLKCPHTRQNLSNEIWTVTRNFSCRSRSAVPCFALSRSKGISSVGRLFLSRVRSCTRLLQEV